MPLSWEDVAKRLNEAETVLNETRSVSAKGPLYAGIDLGTADVVLMVLDENGFPVAAFLEWAEVVRDGVVVDFIGAVDIVKALLKKAEKRLGVQLTEASTSFPPGTEPRLSINILETAGLDVSAVRDEPSCVAALLELDKAAVVDVGGGTTGTAVVEKGKVVFSDEEPSGGRHITLSIAGHFDISLEEAEKRKRLHDRYNILNLARPTILRICDIVKGHIKGHPVERIILTGGTCLMPGIDQIFFEELNIPVQLPSQPLLLTPLAIASLPVV